MNKQFARIALLVLFVLIFFGAIYRYGPNVVFYFDQQNGTAKVNSISRKIVDLEYYHQGEAQIIKLSFREGNAKKLRSLEIGSTIPIIYSKNYPSRMAILDYDQKPDLSELILILICSLPIVFFKKIK